MCPLKTFALIGRPLGHSASAEYFAAKFAREHIADCTYTLYELAGIAELLQLLAETPDLCGFNVTIPYKREVMAYLDSLSDEARAVGAVNCVRRETDGRLTGYNTDIIGLRASFDALLGTARPANALILGTGGASQAVQYVLAERGIAFSTVSRSDSKFKHEISDGTEKIKRYTYINIPAQVIAQSHLIINATPVGTWPEVDAAPQIAYALLTPRHFLLDLVYNPSVTRFLELGRRYGARTMNGKMMFEAQAEASWGIWNGGLPKMKPQK